MAGIIGGLDDAALRRLSNENIPSSINPATKATWIPKPVNSRYHVLNVMAGLLAHARHQAEQAQLDGLPDFASMELCETAGQIPRKMQAFARDRGCNFIRTNRTIDYPALMKWLRANIFDPLFSGDTGAIAKLGLAGAEYIDGQREKDLLTRAQRIDQEAKNAENIGRLHDLGAIENRVRSELLVPIYTGILACMKKHRRFQASNGAITREIVERDLPELLKTIGTGDKFQPSEPAEDYAI